MMIDGLFVPDDPDILEIIADSKDYEQKPASQKWPRCH